MAEVLLCTLASRTSIAEKYLVDLTGPWQLFVDDHLVASLGREGAEVFFARTAPPRPAATQP